MTVQPAPSIKINWLLGTLAAFALFAIIGIYSSSMARHYTDYDQLRAQQRITTLKKLQDDAAKTLNGPADWIDQNKGTVHIPIDEAMAREIDTLKSSPAQMGAEIPVAPAAKPKPAPTAPPASTNAAPAAPVTAAPVAPAKNATPAPAKPNK